MWAIVVIGIFSATYQGQQMQIDGDSLQMMMEMSGDITIVQKGFKSESECKTQLASIQGKHQIKVNGVDIAIHSAECKGEENGDKGRGPKA